MSPVELLVSVTVTGAVSPSGSAAKLATTAPAGGSVTVMVEVVVLLLPSSPVTVSVIV